MTGKNYRLISRKKKMIINEVKEIVEVANKLNIDYNFSIHKTTKFYVLLAVSTAIKLMQMYLDSKKKYE